MPAEIPSPHDTLTVKPQSAPADIPEPRLAIDIFSFRFIPVNLIQIAIVTMLRDPQIINA